MLIIPAIDLKDGKCVRLKQGRMEDDTVFSDDPVATAQHWVNEGARRLHLVDLTALSQVRQFINLWLKRLQNHNLISQFKLGAVFVHSKPSNTI